MVDDILDGKADLKDYEEPKLRAIERSAQAGEFNVGEIIDGLKKMGKNVVPIYITKDGRWMLSDSLGSIKTFTDPDFNLESQTKFTQYYLDLEESVGKIVFKSKGLFSKTINIDLAFPAFHGSFGEDGTIHGLFEMFGILAVEADCRIEVSDRAVQFTLLCQHEAVVAVADSIVRF